MSVMRKLNAIIVPMIMALLFTLSAKSNFFFDWGFRADRVLGYCGMNIMMGGYIIAEQEETFSLKQITFISVVTAVFFAVSIALVFNLSSDFRNFSMPIFEFSKLHDMKALSGLIIYLAIFSTLIGCSKLICQENSEIKIPGAFSVAVLAAFTLIALQFDFSTLVSYCYPIIGYVGVGYTIFTVMLPFILKVFDKRSGREKSKSTSRLYERS